MSFWEPLRTAEVGRTPYCFPSLGGMELNVGIRAPAHGRTPNKSTSAQRSSFYQVHWYFTPWLFILEVLLDTKCLEQFAWDLAYMTELDPLWDDSVTTFFLNPDASLFSAGLRALLVRGLPRRNLPANRLGRLSCSLSAGLISSCRPLHDEAPSLRSSMGRLRRKRPMRPLSRTDHG